jgi:hypothetical protein
MPAPVDAIIWLEPRQARFAAALCERAGWRVVGAGFPVSAARSEVVSEAVAALGIGGEGGIQGVPFADLRHAVATTDARVLLMMSGLSEEGDRTSVLSPLDDSQLIGTCRSRGIDVVSMEPLPGSLVDLAWQAEGIGGGAGAAPLVRQGGLFRRSSVFTQVRETVALIGAVRAVFLEFVGPPGMGSLAARLVDACAVIDGLAGLGMPESVDAAVAAAGSAGAVHLAPPEKLRHLRGDMTVNLRLPNGAAASLSASDHAGPWRRRVRIVGETGVIEASDGGIVVADPEGRPLDGAAAVPNALAGTDAAAVLGAQLRLEIERRAVADPINWAGVLAIAEAALLSARTGQNESPETLLRMAGVG